MFSYIQFSFFSVAIDIGITFALEKNRLGTQDLPKVTQSASMITKRGPFSFYHITLKPV